MKRSIILALFIGCLIALTSCMGEEAIPDFSLDESADKKVLTKQQMLETDTLKGGCPLCPSD